MTVSFDPAIATVPLPVSPWWQRLHADPNACIRLWCFPCIGAGAATFRPWVRHLVGAAELMTVCLPGREFRWTEASLTRLSDLAARLVDEIGHYADERDVFCGHGMSGLLAFEVARRLRAERTAGPRGLVVGGVRAPHHRRAEKPLHLLSARIFVAAVEQRYGPIPDELHARPEFLELLLPALRADLEADETYEYYERAPLDIPLLALAGREDSVVPMSAMLGWRMHTTSGFQFASVSGGHFFPIEQPAETAGRVREFLATL